jgi:hypothetical protein
VVENALAHDRANDRIESRAVASAGKNPNFHLALQLPHGLALANVEPALAIVATRP